MRENAQEKLYCPLTTTEVAAYAAELALIDDQIRQRRTEAKYAAARAQEDLKELDAKQGDKARLVREKRELRLVDVEEVADFKAKTITTVRLDTGEIVRARTMTSTELQVELDLKASIKADTPPVEEVTIKTEFTLAEIMEKAEVTENPPKKRRYKPSSVAPEDPGDPGEVVKDN